MVDPATWELLFKECNIAPPKRGGVLVTDPFFTLALQAHSYEKSDGVQPTRVNVSLQTGSEDYNRQKVSITVSCPCMPHETAITAAAQACYILGKELLNQAAAATGLPPLE